MLRSCQGDRHLARSVLLACNPECVCFESNMPLIMFNRLTLHVLWRATAPWPIDQRTADVASGRTPPKQQMCLRNWLSQHAPRSSVSLAPSISYSAALCRRSSLMRNHATYSAGRKISVSSVATASPPMIAYAKGPQNTVGAMGISPKIAAADVRRIGRSLCVVAWMTLSQGDPPRLISI